MVLHFIYHHKKFSEIKTIDDVMRISIESSRLWFFTGEGAYSLLLSKISYIKVWEYEK